MEGGDGGRCREPEEKEVFREGGVVCIGTLLDELLGVGLVSAGAAEFEAP